MSRFRRVLAALGFEARELWRRHRLGLLGLVLLIGAAGLVPRAIFRGGGPDPVLELAREGSLAGVALLILVVNGLAFAVILAGFTFLYWRGVPIAVERCRRIRLRDCDAWERLARSQRERLVFSLGLAPVVLLAAVVNGMRLIGGCPVNPATLTTVIVEGVRHVYGALEILALLLALVGPALSSPRARALAALAGFASLAAAALIEAWLIVRQLG